MNYPGLKIFTLLLLGQAISLLGTTLTAFGLGVWAFEKTGSVTNFALIALASTVPAAILSPFAGGYVDRWNRKRVLLTGQVAAAMVSLSLALIYWFADLQVWHIMALAALAAMFNAFVMPAITSSITMMVPPHELARANGMMALAVGVVKLLGPVMAGAILVNIGLKGIFVLDLSSFVIGITTLALVRIPQPEKTTQHQEESVLASLATAWQFLQRRPGLLGLLFFFATLSFYQASINVLIGPMVLGFSDAQGLGIVSSVAGFGMILGSVLVMSLGQLRRKVFVIMGAALAMSIGFIIVPMPSSLLLVSIGGLCIMAAFPFATAISQQIFQTKVEADMQGRMFGFSGFLVGIVTPLAMIVVGPLSDQIFEPLMAVDGAWAQSLGPYYGTGAGRGVAVLISTFGAASLCTLALAFLYRPIRRIDLDLPDVEVRDLAQPAPGQAATAETLDSKVAAAN